MQGVMNRHHHHAGTDLDTSNPVRIDTASTSGTVRTSSATASRRMRGGLPGRSMCRWARCDQRDPAPDWSMANLRYGLRDARAGGERAANAL